MRILVGTCGFNRGRNATFKSLDVVELQQTFYDPPPVEKLKARRKSAPENFEFTVKAWMLVTHRYNKNLWKRLKRSISGNTSNYGFFQPTREVLWAWNVTLESAEAANASVIVLQSPSSFKPTSENIANLEWFLSHADRRRLKLGWEPRGEWWQKPDLLKRLSREYDLIIIGDYLRGRISPLITRITYTRLHGLGGKEVNYKYKYTDEDLCRLTEILDKIQSKKTYVLFNNVFSFTDAVRFKEILHNREICTEFS